MIYVMSDLHGRGGAFARMLEKIAFGPNDHLYILGDVIDRGPDGVALLQDLLRRSNVTLLRGNHEQLMLDALLDPDPINNVHMTTWVLNGCQPTLEALQQLSGDDFVRLIHAVNALPLELEIDVGSRHFRLVHAAPDYTYDALADFRCDHRHHMLWTRIPVDAWLDSGETLIFGHTQTYLYTLKEPQCIWYGKDRVDIDCGCALDTGRLACLRLDDMQEFYEEL